MQKTYVLFIALVLLAGLPAPAQFSGRAAGSLVDASGAPVAGAKVSLSLEGSSRAMLTTQSAADGAWRLTGIRPGDYSLTVEAQGFARSTIRGVAVDAARETDLPPIR